VGESGGGVGICCCNCVSKGVKGVEEDARLGVDGYGFIRVCVSEMVGWDFSSFCTEKCSYMLVMSEIELPSGALSTRRNP
jgi:hypothetical protein